MPKETSTSKAGTMFSEMERMVTLTQLNNFSLNPHAFWGMIESYIENIHPLPVKWVYTYHKDDPLMDPRAKSKGLVELYIYAVGNNSSKFQGSPKKLDQVFTKLFCSSYYKNMRPLPVSFQVMDAIEIHLRTPGEGEYDRKNPLRKIFNPFE